MHTTIVTWPQDPTVITNDKPEADQLTARSRVQQFVDAVVTAHGSTYQNIVSQSTQPNGSVLVTRNWPDQATAEAWLELIQSMNGTGTYSFT
jgi:hypothetical protein